MNTLVVASRKWDSPNIEVFVSPREIGVKMDLNDFIHSVVMEIGNPTLIVSQSALEAKLKSAARDVISEMKKETAKMV